MCLMAVYYNSSVFVATALIAIKNDLKTHVVNWKSGIRMLWILVVWRMVTCSPTGSVSALNLSMKLPTCLTRLKCSSAPFNEATTLLNKIEMQLGILCKLVLEQTRHH